MSTNMKKNTFSLLFLILLFLFWGDVCSATVWYVSPMGNDSTGNGTIDKPWYSPQKARKSTGAIAAGDTVIFKNGTYTYNSNTCLIGYSGDDSGTSDAVITYKAEDTSHSVILDFSGGYGWRLSNTSGASYITIDGLVIINNIQSVRFDDGHQTAKNCYMTCNTTWPPTGEPLSGAVSSACFTTYNDATNFLAENNICDSCGYNEGTEASPKSSSHGMYIHDGSGIIRDNEIRNQIGCGLQIQANSSDRYIYQIDVYRNKIHDAGAGIYSSSYEGGTIENIKTLTTRQAGMKVQTLGL